MLPHLVVKRFWILVNYTENCLKKEGIDSSVGSFEQGRDIGSINLAFDGINEIAQ